MDCYKRKLRRIKKLMIKYGKKLKNRVKFQNDLYMNDIKEYKKIYNELLLILIILRNISIYFLPNLPFLNSSQIVI